MMKMLFTPGLTLAKHVLQRESLIDVGLKMVFFTSGVLWVMLYGNTFLEILLFHHIYLQCNE